MNNKEEVKHWFSFEDIYREGREKSRSNTPKEEMKEEECFGANPDCFNITLSGDTVDYIGFAPHAINQLDNILYSCSKGIVGYQDIPVASREESGVFSFPTRRGLTPRVHTRHHLPRRTQLASFRELRGK